MNDEHLREAADFFHEREGDLLARTEAVTTLARRLDVDATKASELLAGLTGDEVDPVIAVRTASETFVGILDYHEGDGWYGFTDYHDFRGEFRHGVCAQCVHEATTDEEVHTVTTGEDEQDGPTTDDGRESSALEDVWDDVATDLRNHYQQAHPNVAPETVSVETGAILRSRTTVGGNRVWHTGNDGAGSGFGSETVDGVEGATLNRRHTSDVDRHLDIERLGLQQWYPANEGTGSYATDWSQHGRHAELRNGTSWTSGRTNGGLSFDGSDDYCAVDYRYDTSGAIDDLTVMAWVRTSSSADQIVLAHDRNEYYRFSASSEHDSTGSAVVGFNTHSENGSTHDFYGSTGIDDGSWHHIAATYDETTGDKRIYVDGTEDASTSAYSDGTSLGSGVTRYGIMGTGSEAASYDGSRGPDNYLNGALDDVRVYHRALSGSEIQAIYDGVA